MTILSKEVWDITPIPQRVINCQAAGLSGRVAGKEWDNLEYDEMMAVMGLQAPVYAISAEVEAKIQARQEEIAAGMRSIASDIVAKALASK